MKIPGLISLLKHLISFEELILIPELNQILKSIVIPFPEQITIPRSIPIPAPIPILEPMPILERIVEPIPIGKLPFPGRFRIQI